MEFLFTVESLGLSFMEIRLGANGIGGMAAAAIYAILDLHSLISYAAAYVKY